MSDRFRWSLAALAVGALAAVLLTAFHLAGRADRELKYVEQGEASAARFPRQEDGQRRKVRLERSHGGASQATLGSEATITR